MAQSRYCDSVTTGGQVLPVFLLGRPHHVDFDLTLAASWSQDDDSTSAPHLGKGIPQQAVPFYSAFLELLFSSFHFDLIGQNKLMCQGGENIFFFINNIYIFLAGQIVALEQNQVSVSKEREKIDIAKAN